MLYLGVGTHRPASASTLFFCVYFLFCGGVEPISRIFCVRNHGNHIFCVLHSYVLFAIYINAFALLLMCCLARYQRAPGLMVCCKPNCGNPEDKWSLWNNENICGRVFAARASVSKRTPIVTDGKFKRLNKFRIATVERRLDYNFFSFLFFWFISMRNCDEWIDSRKKWKIEIKKKKSLEISDCFSVLEKRRKISTKVNLVQFRTR